MPLHRGAAVALRNADIELEDTGVTVPAVDRRVKRPAHVLRLPSSSGATIYFVDHAGYFDRPELYSSGGGRDLCDEPARYAMLSRAAIAAAPALMDAPPDVVHAHDWQAGLAPVMMRRDASATYAESAAAFTIHNLAYQGTFPKTWVPTLGLHWADFHLDAFELYDQVCFLKAGIAFADGVTTVSPTYAGEITTPEHGEGLDGFLRAHGARLSGILNGIDTTIWDPATDPHIAAHYDASALAGKQRCREALLERFGLEAEAEDPLFGVVSRFAWQKGLAVLADIVPALVRLGVRLIVLGSGDPDLAVRFQELAVRFPDNVAVYVGFEPPLSHMVEAGADAFLMPSRYEPCGLNQMYSMRYGTLPIVHAVGGLADTVVDVGTGTPVADATGFSFDELTPAGLLLACRRAVRLYRENRRAWKAVMLEGMRREFGWAPAAQAYRDAYVRALAERRTPRRVTRRRLRPTPLP